MVARGNEVVVGPAIFPISIQPNVLDSPFQRADWRREAQDWRRVAADWRRDAEAQNSV